MIPPPPAYRLGCPVWACDGWVGELYSTKDRRRWLGEYSSVFGTVEGNTTFYALPPSETVARWATEARPGFRFVLKTPRDITHERMLVGAESLTAEWVDRLRQLQAADVLGPTLLQLPPYFGGSQLADLARYLQAWPADLPLAVEPRHEDYFDGAGCERDFDALLRERGADRTLFDSRPLFHAAPQDAIEQASQKRKPNPPHRTTATGRRPMVRLVGRNRLEQADPWVEAWAGVVAGWITAGLSPYFFCHAPDDTLAPTFAERFHAALSQRVEGLAPQPKWPGHAAPKQLGLF